MAPFLNNWCCCFCGHEEFVVADVLLCSCFSSFIDWMDILFFWQRQVFSICCWWELSGGWELTDATLPLCNQHYATVPLATLLAGQVTTIQPSAGYKPPTNSHSGGKPVRNSSLAHWCQFLYFLIWFESYIVWSRCTTSSNCSRVGFSGVTGVTQLWCKYHEKVFLIVLCNTNVWRDMSGRFSL